MQGRLLPRYKNRYQAFPKDSWQSEFAIAKEVGFKGIEFILDYEDASDNPLLSLSGVQEICKCISDSGVSVRSVCADYFMLAPFHSEHQVESEKILKKLLEHCSELPVKDVVIPCVDASSLKTSEHEDMLVASLNRLLPVATRHNIFLNLETDLAPERFKKLLSRFDSPFIKVNYDSGNSASLGFDVDEEFSAYGNLISDLHIKDRILKGGSVPLGTGNAKLERVFELLAKHNFQGNICMQAARAEKVEDEIALVKKQFKIVEGFITRYLN
jgi:L-ribulose-5-phosphate 3-epimerase